MSKIQNIIFTKSFNPKDTPNEVGEYLRHYFFKEKKGEFGCYSTFEIQDYVKQLEDEPILIPDGEEWEDLGEIKYKVFEATLGLKKIKMMYYWDGDGTLEFHFEDGSYLVNDDCKKDYGWEYVE